MKKILLLGAGRTAPFLVRYLLDHASQDDYHLTVGDRDRSQAVALVVGHPAGEAITVDAGDASELSSLVGDFDLVVSLMPPVLQPRVARACLAARVSMVSASYLDDETRQLDTEASDHGVAILTELGLDPGIDLMSAMELIQRLHDAGAVIEGFESYGGGVPAPESADCNPLRYGLTWNPRNVVMAAHDGAQFLHGDRLRIVPWHRIFKATWPIEIAGVGTLDAYPNRDSLSYRRSLELDEVTTLVRGTLRYRGWCETWHQVVRLGLPNETVVIPNLPEMSWRDLVEAFMPAHDPVDEPLDLRVANLLSLDPSGLAMNNLRWLGLFSSTKIGGSGNTAAQAMSQLLQEKLALPATERDMVILHHILKVRYPGEDNRRETIRSTLVELGEAGGITSMSRTVGLPAGIAARLLLRGELTVTGCALPVERRIYKPLLRELEVEGIRFAEQVTVT